MKLWRKMQAYNFTMNEKDRSRMSLFESFKLDDLIKEKHGITSDELSIIVDHYKLLSDKRFANI